MTAALYVVVGLAFLWSLARDKTKAKQSLQVAARMLRGMLPSVVLMVGLVGLVVGLLPPPVIARYMGPGTGFLGTVAAALVGAVTLIPSIIAFPLAGSLLGMGASVATIAAFITTLTMVGVVTAPLEAKELGKRFTVWRNGLSFLAALLIALVMGVVLS